MDVGQDTSPPPLTPISFLQRSGTIFSERLAIIDGDRRFTYGEFLERSKRLASAVRNAGIKPGDRVAALCVNSHVMLEMHNGIPGSGAVLVPLNFRLSQEDLLMILRRSGASMLFADVECHELARSVASELGLRVVISGEDGTYETMLKESEPDDFTVSSELDLLTINYTSGSTGSPKGVMYNHRGAFLQSLAMSYHLGLDLESTYLWTLPMFHCDGWCHTWAVTAAGATHNCVRRIDPEAIWRTIANEPITHLAGAPIVLTMITEAAAKSSLPRSSRTVTAATGGSPPTPTLINRLLEMNISVIHLYGLTETYGPVVVNQWQPEWSASSETDRFALAARQGVGNIVTSDMRVVDADGHEVDNDGVSLGEILLRGNNVMVGYYGDPEGTAAVLSGGWLRTGDLAVRHPDGYVEVRDRHKDIVIVGGENVSSVEVERIICEHQAVLEAAVVSLPDEHWGEVPVAVVTLRETHTATELEIIEYVRSRTSHFKAPKKVHFAEIPKTSTGKVQKHVLRDWVRSIS